jgi:hypothetical protein
MIQDLVMLKQTLLCIDRQPGIQKVVCYISRKETLGKGMGTYINGAHPHIPDKSDFYE